MSEFADYEGPRSDESTVHVVLDDNRGLKAVLTSRVGARSMKSSQGYRKTVSVTVVDGEAHIGNKLWLICDVESGWPSVAYHSEADARERAASDSAFDDEYVYGGEVQYWNVTTEKLERAGELE